MLGGLGVPQAHAANALPVFTSPATTPHSAPEGKVALAWVAPGAKDSWRFQVQQGRTDDFAKTRTLYEGLDLATYVSGLPAGDFYYRVRALDEMNQPGPWSHSVQVRVEYASKSLVAGLSALGLVAFALTVLAVMLGHHRAAREGALEP